MEMKECERESSSAKNVMNGRKKDGVRNKRWVEGDTRGGKCDGRKGEKERLPFLSSNHPRPTT
jgi:hypothetical protein